MKVYVVTIAKPLEPEMYETVKGSAKAAEKYIRSRFPNTRKEESFGGRTSYFCKDKAGAYIMFIREEVVE